jgi:hypothetical protein
MAGVTVVLALIVVLYYYCKKISLSNVTFNRSSPVRTDEEIIPGLPGIAGVADTSSSSVPSLTI